jgi:hypothetical protein
MRNLTSDGSPGSLPAERSYKLTGAANQLLPGRFRANARVDYFSSLQMNQTYNLDLNNASSSQRYFGGNVAGNRGTFSMNGTVERTEFFYNSRSSAVTGGWPRIGIQRSERPVGDTPLYASASGGYANIISNRKDAVQEFDSGVAKLDFAPRMRFPFKRWQWFTVNTSASWRDTFYSRTYELDPQTGRPATDPVTGQPVILDDNLNRQYFTVDAQITGPVFNRVWDTPENGYAEKFKHTIEPYVNLGRTSAITEYQRIVKLESIDQTVGGNIQYAYGLVNRFYAKRRSPIPGQAGQAREFLTVEVNQTYNTNQLATTIDPNYSSSNNGEEENHFSPIRLTVRAQPTPELNATARAEFDSKYRALRTIDVVGSYAWSSQLQTSAGWHKRGFIPELPEFSNPARLNQSVDLSSTLRTRDNKYGTIYSFNYDVLFKTMIQQRLSAFYNAQCCGLAFEFQNWHFGVGGAAPVTTDRRFFMSFTLAGLGNFSPFNGALGGVPR